MSYSNKKNKFGELLIIAAVVMFLLITPSRINAIPIIQIGISRQILLIIVLLICLIVSLYKLKIRIKEKAIVITLVLRVVFLGLYSLFFLEDSLHYLSYFQIISILPILFISIQNLNIDVQKILTTLIKLSVIIVGIQTATAFLTLVIQKHGLYQIKTLIAIPFGNSNTIATIVIIQAVICYYFVNNKLYFAISTITLLFTISKWGFLSFAIVIMIAFLMNTNTRNKCRNILLYLIVFIVIYNVLSRILPSYLSVYSVTLNRVFNSDFGNLFNGRDMLFGEYKELISQKLILGHGLGIETPVFGMAHNFLLQSLYFGGIIGTIIYFLPYIMISHRGLKKSNKQEKMALPLCIIALFINGFAENVFFTAPAEFLSGVFISLIYKYLTEGEIDRNE